MRDKLPIVILNVS